MLEVTADIWDLHASGEWVCVTTNGVVKTNGHAVMGAGIAKTAALKFPGLPRRLGADIRHCGPKVTAFPDLRIIAFPTKFDWRDDSSLDLIALSCDQLMASIGELGIERVYLPRPGCSHGRLSWRIVKARIESLLDDRVTICSF